MKKDAKSKAEEKAEKRDMATLMLGVVDRMKPANLDCALDDALPATFLQIASSMDHIPLFDTSLVSFLRMAPTVLDKAGELASVLARSGITDPDDVDGLRRALELEMETNRMLKRTPKYYPLAWIAPEAELRVLVTPMDSVVQGCIYSMAAPMPSQEPLKLQHAFYGFMVAYLFRQLPLTEHSEMRYGYYVSDDNRLHLFMSVVR